MDYISGPMRGRRRFNFDQFDSVRDFLIDLGRAPWSPADNDRRRFPDIENRPGFQEGIVMDEQEEFLDLLRDDIRALADCDAIVLLPDWEHSKGARIERRVAEDLRLDVYHAIPDGDSWRLELEEPCELVGMNGYGQTGKDTAAEAAEFYGWERRAFADKLREVLYVLNPTVRWGWGGYIPLQELVDTIGWERAKKESQDVRPLLQRLGTDAGRKLIHEDVWVEAVMSDLMPGRRYIFTDVRFPNEARAIEARGGHIWRVERFKADGTLVGPANDHPSETALDDWPHELMFLNIDGQRDEYQKSVVAALKGL